MFEPPTNCPACNQELEWINAQLFCYNENCSGKLDKKVEHFCKTLKIKGLGPSTIKEANIKSIFDIYSTNFECSLKSSKIGEKINIEVEKSKSSSLNTLLPAFGIPLVGKVATENLSKVSNSIFDITEETCKEAGLGEKTTNNLIDWLSLNLESYIKLPFDFLFINRKEGTKGVICISGKLKNKTKSEAKKELELLGYKTVDNVTKETTHLINESGKSTEKTKKAEKQNIFIIEDLNKFIGEINNGKVE